MKTALDIQTWLLTYVPNRMSGADYKLERVRRLLECAGNPQNDLKVVHVAGTSGKTSTAYFVRALLESTGAKVGLTVSPHIQTICERVQIGSQPISEPQFVEYFNEFYPLVSGLDPRPTYFEIMVAFAYWVFKKEAVDYAVVEVGLGGRYDATNTIYRNDKVCVINSVGYDHTEILGESLTEIAGEKAGIIQQNNAVFTVEQAPEVVAVIAAEAQKKRASLAVVRPEEDHSSPVPSFQQHNFHLALTAARYVAKRDGLQLAGDTEQLAQSITVPGRFEAYVAGEKTILLDGAHNPQKLEALLSVLKERQMQPAVVIAAISEAPKKKVVECTQLLANYATKIIYTTFTLHGDVVRRSVDLVTLSEYARPEDALVERSENALQEALASDTNYVIVTGSLYLVSALRPAVQRLAGLLT